mgnify:CR=1 FL=1
MNNYSTKNQEQWLRIFDKYNIIGELEKQSVFQIHSSQINEFRQARLMTKFDHHSQLPPIFKKNKLSILPNSRGTYLIGAFNTFQLFDDKHVEIREIEIPKNFESLDFANISSESTAINCAYCAGVLHDFLEDGNLYPTVSGRMSSGEFKFKIEQTAGSNDFSLHIKNAQIEIDGGFEGKQYLNLIEAKNSISNDFLIRQLYYPFRLWNSKLKKKVKPIFLTYSNGIFHLREFCFTNENHYNAIKLLKTQKYVLKDRTLNINEVYSIYNNTKVESYPTSIPFPQANSFDRIINLCELIKANAFLSKDFITQNYDFDPRQSDYYTNAGRYLGLIEKLNIENEPHYRLTHEGIVTFSKPLKERQLSLVKHILKFSAFRSSMTYYFQKGKLPSEDYIAQIITNSKLKHLSSTSTIKRRASTVSNWLFWITNQLN